MCNSNKRGSVRDLCDCLVLKKIKIKAKKVSVYGVASLVSVTINLWLQFVTVSKQFVTVSLVYVN